jgi:anaerobic magnesium-protoporphyrin IX monomethyl ester cyclase
MRVLLVGPEEEENLSIRYLSSSLSAAGHCAEIAPFNRARDMDTIVERAADADLVGLSLCFQVRAREFLELARRIKQETPSRPIVAGGHYASCAARELLLNHPQIDVVVIHEGEHALVEIADSGGFPGEALHQIRGIAYREAGGVRFTEPRPMVEDLDSLPIPDRRGPVRLLAGVPTAYLLGGRGCLNSCDYCCITTLHRLAPGTRFRQRATDKIADEMSSLYRERGVRQFMFHDDNFLVPSEERNMRRLNALKAALRRRGVVDIGLVLKCRPADVTFKVFRKLRSLGLIRVFLGIESSTSCGLSSIGRRQNVAVSERALEISRQLGISAQFTILTFHPEATLGTVRSDIAFMRKYMDHPLNFARAELYAGTPLEKRMIDAGRARGNYLARGYSLLDPAADLACTLSKRIFLQRCWDGESLLSRAIGLDHLSAVMKRFHHSAATDALCNDIGAWRLAVNRDTLALLERLVDACEVCTGASDPVFHRTVQQISEEEIASRARLAAQGEKLAADVAGLSLVPNAPRLPGDAARKGAAATRRAKERHAASAVVALSLIGAVSVTAGAAGNEYAPKPLDLQRDEDGDGLYDAYETEIFKTRVGVKDSDGNGIPDAEEDHDSDGVVNLEEQKMIIALMGAVARGDIEATKALLAQGPVLDAADEQGLTPLMRAVFDERIELVRLLLAAGADVNVKGYRGYRGIGNYTALMIAKERRSKDIVKLLQEAGATE